MKESNATFKEAMKRLELIVSKLEKNDIELEEAISYYEEGLKLIQTCDIKLKDFEGKVQSLMKVYGSDEQD
ncbi:MAG: exodeoxyribonuclease VII small subunit [Breznakia sp.]